MTSLTQPLSSDRWLVWLHHDILFSMYMYIPGCVCVLPQDEEYARQLHMMLNPSSPEVNRDRELALAMFKDELPSDAVCDVCCYYTRILCSRIYTCTYMYIHVH